MSESVAQQLAPSGVLRTGVNMSNFLLVTDTDEHGDPDGVSPAMARALAAELGLDTHIIPFRGPGELADAVASNGWDIGNIAAEPERARTITFSPAYCEIQATYLVPPESPLQSLAAIDAEGVRIAVKGRSAYDLFLTDHLQHAELVRFDSIDASFEGFVAQRLDVLAGLRPALIKQQPELPGSTILELSFTAVQQSIGCRPGQPEVAAYIADFVQRAIRDGVVAKLIDHYGVAGRLAVAGAT